MASGSTRLWATKAASYFKISSPLRHFSTGISDHAQGQLGDVIFVQLPEVGTKVTQGSAFGAAESVKATSDVNSPVSGKVIEINEELFSSPGLVNGSPHDKGWFLKVEISNTGELNKLMDAHQYTKYCEKEDTELI